MNTEQTSKKKNIFMKKIKLNFYFHNSLWCLKRFYQGLKVFIKPFEGPQRSVKIKIELNFYFNTAFKNDRVFKG